MKDQSKTKQVLIQELVSLRQRIAELEQSESERKRAEEALRHSEERYRTLVENASDIVFRTDNAGLFTFVNPAALRITGYKEDEILGIHYPTLIRPDMREEAIKFFGRQFVKGIKNTYSEYPILTKDGHEVWLGQNIQLIVEDGHVVGFQAVSRDITDRKRLEENLIASEKKYRNLVDNTLVGVYQTNLEGRILYANQAFVDMFGYDSPEELMSINMSSLYKNKEDRKKFIEAIKKDCKLLNYDLELVTKDGEDKDIILSGVIDGDSMLGTLVDITGRKRAEAILRESEEKYRNILSSIEDGYHEVDLKGNFTFVSSSMAKILGYEESELLGMNYRKYMGELDAKNVFKSYNEVYRTGIPSKLTGWEFIRKDGTKIAAEGSVSLVKSKDLVIGFRGIIRDVTDKKKAEDALRESEEKYRTLLNNIEDGCYEVDLAGNFTFVNPSMTHILGYTEEELIGMNNRQYSDKENAKKVFQAFNMVYKTGVPTRHFGWELIRKDGTKAFVGCSVSLIKDSSDNPIGFRGVLNDITERKRAEAALEEERRRLQQALDEVRTLRGIVPICANCKKIRDDKGYWGQVEKYVSDHTGAKFSHGICPDCMKIVYPEYKKQ